MHYHQQEKNNTSSDSGLSPNVVTRRPKEQVVHGLKLFKKPIKMRVKRAFSGLLADCPHYRNLAMKFKDSCGRCRRFDRKNCLNFEIFSSVERGNFFRAAPARRETSRPMQTSPTCLVREQAMKKIGWRPDKEDLQRLLKLFQTKIPAFPFARQTRKCLHRIKYNLPQLKEQKCSSFGRPMKPEMNFDQDKQLKTGL